MKKSGLPQAPAKRSLIGKDLGNAPLAVPAFFHSFPAAFAASGKSEVRQAMMVLVAYDVSTESPRGRRRLRRVAKLCEDYGQRVQKSLFECLIDPGQWARLRHGLIDEIECEHDSLRFYFLGKNWKPRVEHVGAKPGYDPQGAIVV